MTCCSYSSWRWSVSMLQPDSHAGKTVVLKKYTYIDWFPCHVLSKIHYSVIIYEFSLISLLIASFPVASREQESMTNMFSDLTISNCMLIFILEFIYGWSDCTADFECKEYLPGEN